MCIHGWYIYVPMYIHGYYVLCTLRVGPGIWGSDPPSLVAQDDGTRSWVECTCTMYIVGVWEDIIHGSQQFQNTEYADKRSATRREPDPLELEPGTFELECSMLQHLKLQGTCMDLYNT